MTLRGVPDQIGRYQILSELGRGSMGHVYLALDPNIERQIALKVLLPMLKVGRQEQAELRQRFLIEARAAGRLKHPGVVTLFDADTDFETGLSFIAMEWVDGPSLHELLRQSGTLPIQKTLEIIEQVALALDAAHRADLVHRDIKPANVLLTASGQAKVTDFGIAKLTSMSITATGWMPGSPFYMSPEQVRGHDIDGRSDLYSLGIVLYQCLTGEVPFHGESLASMTYMILEVDPRPPQTLNPAIPDELTDVMVKALQKSPEDRFQTALEFADALRRVPTPRAQESVSHADEPVGIGSWTLGAPRTTPLENSATISVAAADGTTHRIRNNGADSTGSRSVVSSVGRYAFPALALALLFLLGPALRTLASQPERATPVRIEQTEPFRLANTGTRVTLDGSSQLLGINLEPPELALEPEDDSGPTVAAKIPTRPRRHEPRSAPRPAVSPVTPAASTPEETVAAKTVTIPATEPVAVAPVRAANLEVVFKNRLRNAEVSVWIDEEKVWSRAVAGPKSLFKRAVGRNFFTLLAVSEGPHVIDVRVIGREGKVDVVRRTQWDFQGGQTKRLKVTMVPPKKLKLSWGKTDG